MVKEARTTELVYLYSFNREMLSVRPYKHQNFTNEYYLKRQEVPSLQTQINPRSQFMSKDRAIFWAWRIPICG